MIAMRLLLVAAALWGLQDAPARVPGGKVEWWKDVPLALKRAKLEQRALLLYFTDGSVPCKALEDGAFSSDVVAALAKDVIPVLLECMDEKAHEEMKTRFEVGGFPTTAFADPEGKPLGELATQEADAMAAEIAKIARRHPGRPVLWARSQEAGVATARAAEKPLAIYFHDGKQDLIEAQDRVRKLTGSTRADKFTWVEMAATNDDKDPWKVKYEYYDLPAVVILDPRPEDPMKRVLSLFEIYAKSKPATVQQKVDKALKKYKDTKTK